MLDFTRLMLISTQVEVVLEVGVELGKIQKNLSKKIHEMPSKSEAAEEI